MSGTIAILRKCEGNVKKKTTFLLGLYYEYSSEFKKSGENEILSKKSRGDFETYKLKFLATLTLNFSGSN